MAKAIVVLTDGFEEIEALALVDLLRRADIGTVMASITGKLEVTGRCGIRVIADGLFEDSFDVSDLPDALVLPGGPGHKNYFGDGRLIKAVKAQDAAGQLVCAICAAPAFLVECGVIGERKFVCYPGVEEGFGGAAAGLTKETVEISGNLITSRGPATAFKFGLAIIWKLLGDEAVSAVGGGILFDER